MRKETRIFLGIFIGLILTLCLCWIIRPEQNFDQQVVECNNPIDTVITMTAIGWGYEDYDSGISTTIMNQTVTQTITTCRGHQIYLPIIMK